MSYIDEVYKELSKKKVGQVIYDYEFRGFDLIKNVLKYTKYAVSAGKRDAILVRKINPYISINELAKTKMSKKEFQEYEIVFWVKNYNPKYKHYIPAFYAVYRPIYYNLGKTFYIDDYLKDHPHIDSKYFSDLMGMFRRIGVVCGGRGKYEVIDKIPDFITSRADLASYIRKKKKGKPSRYSRANIKKERMEKEKKRKVYFSKKNEFLKDMAKKAGLI